MKTNVLIFLVFLVSRITAQEKITQTAVEKYKNICRTNIFSDYKGMYKEPKGALKYHYITPGSKAYNTQLWDWDSWLTNVALEQIVIESGTKRDKEEALKYQQGCVLNFLRYQQWGWIPIHISVDSPEPAQFCPENPHIVNKHKPVLAQHTAFIVQQNNGDAHWLQEHFADIQQFVNHYISHQKHRQTGLYFWFDSHGIGVDNDPSTFYRPDKSSANIFLNCLMYKELEAMVYLCERLNLNEIGVYYQREANELKAAIQKHCWDEWTGFYYSCDLNLLPVTEPDKPWTLHSGNPRNYDCLIQRIHGWSGFMAMWAGIATPEQAKRIVNDHYKDTSTFNCNYGIRTLSKLEKMYDLRASGNPSSWLGPVWGISNYLTFKGLVKYGFKNEAKELASKTIVLFGQDFEKSGALHEYYVPDNGTPVLNKGFQNWNYLVINMAAWLDNKTIVSEF